MGLRRGKSCVAFEDMAALDNAARVAVGKYDGALKQGMREGRGGGEDVSDVELGARRTAKARRARRPRACRARTSSVVAARAEPLLPPARRPRRPAQISKGIAGRRPQRGRLGVTQGPRADVDPGSGGGGPHDGRLGLRARPRSHQPGDRRRRRVGAVRVEEDGARVGRLLEQVCKVPALAKLTRREQGVVIDAFRRKVFQGGQRLYVQGKGTDYLYLIEDGTSPSTPTAASRASATCRRPTARATSATRTS